METRLNITRFSLFFFLLASFIAGPVFAQRPGKDGVKTVQGVEVLNRYGTFATPAGSGSSSITAIDITPLLPLTSEDLVLIYQDSGNEGIEKLEIRSVKSIHGNTINFTRPLQYSYDLPANTQIVRVPQFSCLTIPAGSEVVSGKTIGTKEGVVAIHVDGTAFINGTISVRGHEALPVGQTEQTNESVSTDMKTRGLVLLLVDEILGHGTIHAYSGKTFDIVADDCDQGQCDGVVILNGGTVLGGTTVHAKTIHFASLIQKH
jgi:hypothetical protein